jgi:hypothetical protein
MNLNTSSVTATLLVLFLQAEVQIRHVSCFDIQEKKHRNLQQCNHMLGIKKCPQRKTQINSRTKHTLILQATACHGDR